MSSLLPPVYVVRADIFIAHRVRSSDRWPIFHPCFVNSREKVHVAQHSSLYSGLEPPKKTLPVTIV